MESKKRKNPFTHADKLKKKVLKKTPRSMPTDDDIASYLLDCKRNISKAALGVALPLHFDWSGVSQKMPGKVCRVAGKYNIGTVCIHFRFYLNFSEFKRPDDVSTELKKAYDSLEDSLSELYKIQIRKIRNTMKFLQVNTQAISTDCLLPDVKALLLEQGYRVTQTSGGNIIEIP